MTGLKRLSMTIMSSEVRHFGAWGVGLLRPASAVGLRSDEPSDATRRASLLPAAFRARARSQGSAVFRIGPLRSKLDCPTTSNRSPTGCALRFLLPLEQWMKTLGTGPRALADNPAPGIYRNLDEDQARRRGGNSNPCRARCRVTFLLT